MARVFARVFGRARAESLASLVDAKKLEVVVDQGFPFARIAEAFAYLKRGRAKGKVVVTMG